MSILISRAGRPCRIRGILVGFAAALSGLCATATIGADDAEAAQILSFNMTRTTAQAGGHPDIRVDAQFLTKEFGVPNPCFCEDPKTIAFHFPEGFIGNPHAIPKCSLAELGLKICPPDSQVGLAFALFGQQFLYNMEPRPGEPGLIASQIPFLGSPVFNVLGGRTNSDYGLDSVTSDIFHPLGLFRLGFIVWGVPTDPANDKYRAPLGLQNGCFSNYPTPCYTESVDAIAPPAPYLQNPTACEGPLSPSLDVVYYDHSTDRAETTWSETTGCDLLSFNPSLTASITTDQADVPSGIDMTIKVPQTQSPTVPSPSEVRAVRVTLPEGFSINPNAADGKTACTDAEGSFGTLRPAQCPETSKIGTLSIDVSALPAPISGAMYLGEPRPGNRYRVFLAASGFDTHVKLDGSAHLDPRSGRIEVLFERLPQSPLQEFDLHVFGAERGLLATPKRCGTYEINSEFEPWSAVLGTQTSSTVVTIDSGPNGAPCPGSSRPLNPSIVAGSPDNTAGVHSPFAIRVDRSDGDQNVTALHVATPPGFLASLRGVPYCPEATIEMLSDLTYPGQTELTAPACPLASQVGTAMTSAGAGSRPLHAPGKVYLAGPYKEAPVSLVVVVPAVSGPYDLGTVAVRAATYINPANAQVTTVSDPIPQIIDGIPLRLRSILVNLDRPKFTLSPTNCSPFSVNTGVFGDEGGQANPSAYYQVANCSVLAFQPKLGIRLSGSMKRRGNPALTATLRAAPGESNIRRTVVAMPPSLLLDNANIGTICTRVQFAANACPAGAVYGHASATSPLLDGPLAGPVYLRSSNNQLPDLVAHLRGQIDIELVGRIDTTRQGGLRANFDAVPDAPVSTFVLEMEGGSKGLLENSENLCRKPGTVRIRMVGQNSAELMARKKPGSTCSGKAKRSHHQRLLRARAVR